MKCSDLAFSPDGQHLLAGGRNIAFWSTAPVVWNDPDRAAEKLRLLLRSNADFPSRIRMLSENLRLHQALEKLDTKDVEGGAWRVEGKIRPPSGDHPPPATQHQQRDRRVQAALAAAQANWHASRQAWPEAVAAFDRLRAVDPTAPEAWLRTPGLLRLATALLQENRPRDAAALLSGGAGAGPRMGFPPPFSRLELASSIRQPANCCIPLRAALSERLAREPRDPALLELRAELASQWSGFEEQAAELHRCE